MDQWSVDLVDKASSVLSSYFCVHLSYANMLKQWLKICELINNLLLTMCRLWNRRETRSSPNCHRKLTSLKMEVLLT